MCVYVCVYVSTCVVVVGQHEITMLIEALCPGVAASDPVPPSFSVSVTFSTQRQLQGSQIHPTLQRQNQLPER